MYGFRVWIKLTDEQVVIQHNVTLIHYEPTGLVLSSCLHGEMVAYETGAIAELQAWPEHTLAAAFQRKVVALKPLIPCPDTRELGCMHIWDASMLFDGDVTRAEIEQGD